MSVPYWRRPEALGLGRVDVLVVGAGVCGISAAIELLARGLRVAVVERHRPAAGASGRNAGFLMRGMAESYAAACRQHGRDLARTMWCWTEENLEILLSRGAGTLPSFRPTPSCLLALEAGELTELQESLSLLHADGFAADWLERHGDGAWVRSGALGGLVNPADAAVNPWELLGHLAAPLRPLIIEGQEVVRLEPGAAGRGARVTTSDLAFDAQRVLLCTNAYGPLLTPGLASLVEPNRGQMLAIRPDRPYRLDYSYYANRGSEYFRQTPDGTVVVGGKRTTDAAGEVGYGESPTPAIQDQLERFARQVLGLEGTVVARWAGTMGFSRDGLPIVGPVPVEGVDPDVVWFCGGFTGHGMSLAARTARAAVAEIVDGVATPFAIGRFAGDRPA